MIITKLEYLRRFTSTERITIRAAAKVEPVLEDYMALLELAEEINTEDADTIAAVNVLETTGLIASGRSTEILGDVAKQEEPALPTGVATVYRIGENFITCLAGETGPESFDESWEVSALYAALIASGADLHCNNGLLSISMQVV